MKNIINLNIKAYVFLTMLVNDVVQGLMGWVFNGKETKVALVNPLQKDE
jgi:hypothetical protein